MTVRQHHTSDTVTVSIDGEHYVTMDDSAFGTMLRLASEERT